MKRIPEYAYFLIGFAVLTVFLVVIGLARAPSRTPTQEDGLTVREYLKEKPGLIEPQPLLMEPREEVEMEVQSYRSRAKDIIQSDRPLPLLPKEVSTVDPGLLQENGVLKNLYKESNLYYIDDNEENPQKHRRGIKD